MAFNNLDFQNSTLVATVKQQLELFVNDQEAFERQPLQ